MSGLGRRVGALLERRALAVLVAVGVVTAVLAVGAGRLDFATGQDSYLADSTATAKANKAYQSLFGGETMLVLFTAEPGKTVTDLFTPANLRRFDDISQQLRTRSTEGGRPPIVFSVISPATLLGWSSDLVTKGVATEVLGRAAARETDQTKAAARGADAQMTLARVAAAGRPGLENRAWVDFLLHENEGWTLSGRTPVAPPADQLTIRRSLRAFVPDERHAVFAVILKGNASLDELAAGNDLVQQAFAGVEWENADAIVTGTPTFLTDINDYLQGGMVTLGLFAIAAMVLVLALLFGVRWRFLPLAVVVVGVIWGFGAFGFTGTKLSLVTISGLPILIGLGMDFAIQIHNRVNEEITAGTGGSPFETTLQRLGGPLALATVVAVASFLVMLISRVPMIKDFGVLLSIGIVALVVVGVAITASVLALRERRSPTSRPLVRTRSERVVVWLGSLSSRAVLPLVALAVVVPIVGLVLEHDAKIESDPINWANQGTETIRNARTLERESGFATTLGVFITTEGYESNGVFTDQMASFVHGFELSAVADEGKLLPAGASLTSVLSYLIGIPGATPLPPTGQDMLAAYRVAPPDLQRLLVSADGNAMQITFNVGPSPLDRRADLVSRLERAIADPPPGDGALPAGATATPAGLARVGVALLNNLESGRSALTYITLLLVAALLLLRFRNLGLAALAMLPVLVAVGAAATTVALLGITLSPLTTVGAPLVIALCAEFSILMVSRYVEERGQGLAPREAIDRTSARTGRAFAASALATIGGFGVLIFSSLPLLRDFGTIVTLKVALALLSALVVVPPVAVWADQRGLLGLGEPVRQPAAGPLLRWLPIGVGLVLAVAGIGLAMDEGSTGEAAAAPPRTVPAAEAPATLPPATTAPPTTARPVTTVAATTTSAAGAAPSAGAPTTSAAVAPTTAATLPPGPPERPQEFVAGAVYDAFVNAGATAGLARCTADALVGKTSEADLLAKGIATRSAETTALIGEAARTCGVPEEVLAKLASG